MVSSDYSFYQQPTSVREIYKPKQNYLIPIVFLISLSGTVILTTLYILYNKELHWKLAKNANKDRLVCYYNFPKYRNDLQPENIDAHLCTHIIVGFLNVSSSYELGVDQSQIDVLKSVNELKLNNSDLKVLISVGGAGNTEGWPEMVLNHTNRKMFIRSVRIFLKNYTLDGVDLDWEYPNELGVDTKERLHFTQLLEEFRMHIDKGHYKFLLSVAVPALAYRLDNSYQVNYLNLHTDFVNLMTYDYHFYTNYTPFTGLNSPLVKSQLDSGLFNSFNINDSISYYLKEGMDKNKINVGLPTFGHSFTLFNRYNNGVYSPAKGYGRVGSRGYASYPDISRFLKSGNVLKYFDSTTRSSYATKYFEWVSFDDNNSLALKTRFIKEKDLGGVAIYSLNADDFEGNFGDRFTLVKAVKNVLHSCVGRIC